MKHFLLALGILCCIQKMQLERTFYGNPSSYLEKSCSTVRQVNGQSETENERCRLLENIKQYIKSNLLLNFKGLKLKRDFAADLDSSLVNNVVLSNVKYMAAANAPDYKPQYLDELKHALEVSELSLNKAVEDAGANLHSAGNLDNRPVKRSLNVNNLTKVISLDELRHWFETVRSTKKYFSTNVDEFIQNWNTFLPLSHEILSKFTGSVKLSLQESLTAMSLTDAFMQLFWPFRYDVSEMNQKLGLYGLKNQKVNNNLKSSFFKSLEDIQAVKMPFSDDEIIFSFDNPELVDGMNRSKLVVFSDKFVKGKQHLFSEEEQKEIITKTNQALELINKTSPQLYKALVQLISCFAFYKTENPKYLGGSTSSALGIIWLDPSAGHKWEVPFYAEMIVHEFIHTHLFYAELVHGTYADGKLLSKAKVVSAIRGQSRDYDKSLHAAYVSAGLAVFHTRAGYLNRAEQLTGTVLSSVDSLVKVNEETGVLDESGNAMLQFLVDYMTLTGIQTA